MLDFVRRAFRGGLSLMLWIFLLLFVIIGGVAGHLLKEASSYRGDDGSGVFLGMLIGLVIGLIYDIIVGGFIATIINIDENIEKLVKGNMSFTGSIAGPIGKVSSASTEKKKCSRCGKEVDSDYTSCPHCGNKSFE